MNKTMYDYLVENQYRLPSSLYSLALRYNKVTWEQAIHLYEIAVETVLIISGEKNLYSGKFSFGRGLVAAKQEFIELLDKTQKFAEAGEKNE